MRFEPGITNRFHLRLFLEPAGELKRIGAMALHSQRKRLQTPQHQETVEYAGNRAYRILQKPHLIAEVFILTNDGDTANHVGVAIQIFRGGMNNDVEPTLDRPLDPG